MRNWLDYDETSSLSSAERSGAHIEGCELARIQRVRRTLRYDLRSAPVYSGCVLSCILSCILNLSKGLSKPRLELVERGLSKGCLLLNYA